MKQDQQIIEIFHLLFLKSLEKKIDKSLYSLKGGCNLRFFFKSIRYSEDIDFDVMTIAKDTLRKNINVILKGPSFQKILSSQGIEIANFSEPKQTETTQRWKLGLIRLDLNRNLYTKIEFSRRKIDEGLIFEPVDNQILQTYHLQPVLCNHYIKETAFVQKVNALIHRTETQARDIFDIKLLLDCQPDLSKIKTQIELHKLDLSRAIEHALSIGYSEFKGQVVSFLLTEYQDYYNSEKIWNSILDEVIHILEQLQA